MFSGYRRMIRWIARSVALAEFLVGVSAGGAFGQAIQSDDFHATSLNPVWTFSDPVGDATFYLSGTNLILRVPGGVSHTLWDNCDCAPRFLQTVANTDFEIEAKFDSQPSAQYQMQGFMVLEDADTYLRFDVHHDGATARIFAGYVNGINPPVTRINVALPSIPPYLRVTRTASTWAYKYSYNGSTWTTAGTFTRAMSVTKTGLFAGNSNSIEYVTPPFVANVDYFFNTASPIVPEDAGDPTAPTPPVVEVWYGDSQSFGALGVPQQWVNVLGTVWDTDAITSLSYSLNGGPSTPLTIGTDGLRLADKGDFNVEIDVADLSPGVNEVVITAVDALAEERHHSVNIDYTAGVTWPLPSTASFTTASAISDVAQVVDGRWILTGDGVRVDSSGTGYNRDIALGDRTWTTNYEVTTPIIVHAGDLGGSFRVATAIGWQGHTGAEQPRLSNPYQALAGIRDFPANPTLILKDNDQIRAQKSVSIQTGVRYLLKMSSQFVGIGLARVNVKFWQDGTPEPQAWDLSYDFIARSGSIVLVADYSEVTFGDVSVVPLEPLAIQSDDFSSMDLDTDLWRFVDPLGDATLMLSGTNAVVYVPGGSKHTFSSDGNFAPRLLQDAPNTNFEMQAGFGSKGSSTFQQQGLFVGEDDDTYLRFDVIYTSGLPELFAGYFDAGVLTTEKLINVAVAPDHVRVKRIGDQWTFDYSFDGIAWTPIVVFTQNIVVTEAGASFSNTGGDAYYDTPAFVGNIDYFYNTSLPIVPEDGGSPTAETPPVVDLWYGDHQSFGQLGVPQRWVNLPGTVWDGDGIASLSYSLNGGPGQPLGVGPDGFRLVGIGDFNVEIDYGDLSPGSNDVVITAVDTLGEQTDHLVTIDFTPDITWEMPYDADWQSATKIADVACVGDGRWILTSDGVRNAPNGIGYDRFLLIGDESWTPDYDVIVPVTIHAGNLGGVTGVGVAIGWSGHIAAAAAEGQPAQPLVDNRYQAIAWIRNFPASPILQLKDDEVTRGEMAVTMQADVPYWLLVRSETMSPGVAHVSTKFWAAGSQEPAGWMLEDDFASHRGSILLISHKADATFGNPVITPRPAFVLHDLTTIAEEGGSIVRLPDYAAYSDSSKVKLTAVPDEGWLFDHWSGGATGSTNPITLTMIGDVSVTATFKKKAFSLTLWVAGNGSATVDPDTTRFLYGDTLILEAFPDPGSHFYGWSGDHTGSANPDTISVAGDMKITAMFFTDVTGIDSPPAIDALTVIQNSPNPFRDDTYLNIGLPVNSDVEIAVFDVAGRLVNSLRVQGARAGWNRIPFRGIDSAGKTLPSGVYFYKVHTPEATVTKKFVIIR